MIPFNKQFRVTNLNAYENAPGAPRYQVTLVEEYASNFPEQAMAKTEMPSNSVYVQNITSPKLSDYVGVAPAHSFVLDIERGNFQRLCIGDVFELSLKEDFVKAETSGMAGMSPKFR